MEQPGHSAALEAVSWERERSGQGGTHGRKFVAIALLLQESLGGDAGTLQSIADLIGRSSHDIGGFIEYLVSLGGMSVLAPQGRLNLLRLLAAGGSDPDVEHRPVSELPIAPVGHAGVARLGARVRPGWFAQTHVRPDLAGKTLVEILHRGDGHREGMGREQASRALDRYELSAAALQSFDLLSGGQQARFQILLLELSGATLLLLDEPTDNLDLESAEALQTALDAFEGTVLAVTHDRWFAAGFDRFFVLGADGRVRETDGPVWDEGRRAPGERAGMC